MTQKHSMLWSSLVVMHARILTLIRPVVAVERSQDALSLDTEAWRVVLLGRRPVSRLVSCDYRVDEVLVGFEAVIANATSAQSELTAASKILSGFCSQNTAARAVVVTRHTSLSSFWVATRPL